MESCLWQTKRTKNSTPSSARIKRDVSIGAMLTTKKAVSRLQEKGKYRKKGGVSGILGTCTQAMETEHYKGIPQSGLYWQQYALGLGYGWGMSVKLAGCTPAAARSSCARWRWTGPRLA